MQVNVNNLFAMGQTVPREILQDILSNPDLVAYITDHSHTLFDQNDKIQEFLENCIMIISRPRDESKMLSGEQASMMNTALDKLPNANMSNIFPTDWELNFEQEKFDQMVDASAAYLEDAKQRNPNIVESYLEFANRHASESVFVVTEYFEMYPEESEDPVPLAVSDLLPRNFFTLHGPDTFECCVCLGTHCGTLCEVKPDNEALVLIKLGCGHLFDESCILEWFKHKQTCPLCRFHVH